MINNDLVVVVVIFCLLQKNAFMQRLDKNSCDVVSLTLVLFISTDLVAKACSCNYLVASHRQNFLWRSLHVADAVTTNKQTNKSK